VIGSGGPGGGNTIGEDLQIFDNNVEGVFCPPDAPPEECPFFEDGHFNGNVVGGNMQLFKNHGPTESGNTIEANLQCKENEPPPVGDGNTAKQKEEQCAAL
jgi:hypothetical protein